MTQDTNNQEWWMEELYKIEAENGGRLATREAIALIRKVSQQSREDALKEVYEEFDKEWRRRVDGGTMATTYLVCADTVHAILKSKLPSKQ